MPLSYHEKDGGGYSRLVDFSGKIFNVSELPTTDNLYDFSASGKKSFGEKRLKATPDLVEYSVQWLQRYVNTNVSDSTFRSHFKNFRSKLTRIERGCAGGWSSVLFEELLILFTTTPVLPYSKKWSKVFSACKEHLESETANARGRGQLDLSELEDTMLEAFVVLVENLELELSYDPTEMSTPTVSVERCSELDLSRTGVIFLKSGMGTGKTYGCELELRKKLELEPNASILIVSVQRTLLGQYTARFAVLGAKSYSQAKTSPESFPFVISTVDSLKHFRKQQYDYVIIDECEQAFKYLFTNDTTSIKDSRKIVIDSLIRLFKQATTVILCSADLSDYEIEITQKLFTPLFKASDYTFYNNVAPRPQQYLKTFTFVDKLQFREHIYRLIKENKRFKICCDTVAEVHKLAIACRDINPNLRVLEITGEETSEKIESDKVLYERKIDVLISSPALMAGFSVDAPDYFDAILCHFTYSKVDSLSLMQHINRVRICNQVYIYFSDAWISGTPLNNKIVAVRNNLAENEAADYEITDYLSGDVTVAPHHPLVVDFQSGYLNKSHRLTRGRQARLIYAAERCGYTIEGLTALDYTKEQTEELREQKKKINETFKAQETTKVAQAKDITNNQLDELTAARKSRSLTAEESLSATKAWTAKTIGKFVEDLTPTDISEVKFGVSDKDYVSVSNRTIAIDTLNLSPSITFDSTYTNIKHILQMRRIVEAEEEALVKRLAAKINERDGVIGDLAPEMSLACKRFLLSIKSLLVDGDGEPKPINNKTKASLLSSVSAAVSASTKVVKACGLPTKVTSSNLLIWLTKVWSYFGYSRGTVRHNKERLYYFCYLDTSVLNIYYRRRELQRKLTEASEEVYELRKQLANHRPAILDVDSFEPEPDALEESMKRAIVSLKQQQLDITNEIKLLSNAEPVSYTEVPDDAEEVF
jgi:hypothetical protein